MRPRPDTLENNSVCMSMKTKILALRYDTRCYFNVRSKATEPTTKKCKNRRRKTKSRKQICSEITGNSPGNPRSKYLSRRKERLQWE